MWKKGSKKKKGLTRTQRKDLRDEMSLGISFAGLVISGVSLALVLNKKPRLRSEGYERMMKQKKQ